MPEKVYSNLVTCPVAYKVKCYKVCAFWTVIDNYRLFEVVPDYMHKGCTQNCAHYYTLCLGYSFSTSRYCGLKLTLQHYIVWMEVDHRAW